MTPAQRGGAQNSGAGSGTVGEKAYGIWRRPLGFSPVLSLPDLFALFSVIFLIFVVFSRLFDHVAAALRVPTIAFAAAGIGVLLTGGIFQAVKSRIGFHWLAFTCWMIICVITSIWRRGSFELVFQHWPKAMLVFVATAGLLVPWDRCAKAIGSVGWSIAVLSLTSLYLGDASSGRLFLAEGKLSNPNDLAQAILLGLPCLWLIIRLEPTVSVKRLMAGVCSCIALVALFRTGSRGGLVAFGVLMFIVFRDASGRLKALVPVMVALFLLVGVIILPEKVRQRYLTFTMDDLNSQSVDDMSVIAVASTESRLELLRKSVKLTVQHPIFGVGPGMFSEAVEKQAAIDRKHVAYQVSHNAFTEVSSETGVPGLLLYLSIIWVCLRKLWRLEKLLEIQPDEKSRRVRLVAQTLKYMMVVFFVSSNFGSVAYQALLPCLSGLVVAFTSSVDRELVPIARRPAAAQPMMRPLMPPRSLAQSGKLTQNAKLTPATPRPRS